MKQKPIALNTQLEKIMDNTDFDLQPKANGKPNGKKDSYHTAEKIEKIAFHFKAIMETLGLDLSDDSLKDTPQRVAKMYVNELFKGLNPANFPAITLFENRYQYNQILVEKNIAVFSQCEHHFVPIVGKAHIAYISNGKIIGLSKLNRIVNFYSKKPQVQERLTTEIGEALQSVLQTEDIAVIIDAQHFCVITRGIQDESSSTVTTYYNGKFLEDAYRKELWQMIQVKSA